jgi:ABC-2 type transport system ATP-binding protein
VLDDGLVTAATSTPTETLHQLTGWALSRGLTLDRLTVDRPSLEDVYLGLTGATASEGPLERSAR